MNKEFFISKKDNIIKLLFLVFFSLSLFLGYIYDHIFRDSYHDIFLHFLYLFFMIISLFAILSLWSFDGWIGSYLITIKCYAFCVCILALVCASYTLYYIHNSYKVLKSDYEILTVSGKLQSYDPNRYLYNDDGYAIPLETSRPVRVFSSIFQRIDLEVKTSNNIDSSILGLYCGIYAGIKCRELFDFSYGDEVEVFYYKIPYAIKSNKIRYKNSLVGITKDGESLNFLSKYNEVILFEVKFVILSMVFYLISFFLIWRYRYE